MAGVQNKLAVAEATPTMKHCGGGCGPSNESCWEPAATAAACYGCSLLCCACPASSGLTACSTSSHQSIKQLHVFLARWGNYRLLAALQRRLKPSICCKCANDLYAVYNCTGSAPSVLL
jgi:hypothetical protein